MRLAHPLYPVHEQLSVHPSLNPDAKTGAGAGPALHAELFSCLTVGRALTDGDGRRPVQLATWGVFYLCDCVWGDSWPVDLLSIRHTVASSCGQ